MEKSLWQMTSSFKAEYISNLVKSFNNKPKNVFEYLGHIKGQRNVPSIMMDDSKPMHTPTEIADSFNTSLTQYSQIVSSLLPLLTPCIIPHFKCPT